MTESNMKIKISCVVGDITTTIYPDKVTFTQNGNRVIMTAEMSVGEYTALVAEDTMTKEEEQNLENSAAAEREQAELESETQAQYEADEQARAEAEAQYD